LSIKLIKQVLEIMVRNIFSKILEEAFASEIHPKGDKITDKEEEDRQVDNDVRIHGGGI
jgi:hypothetical protein